MWQGWKDTWDDTDNRNVAGRDGTLGDRSTGRRNGMGG